MNATIEGQMQTKVYTTDDGRVAIEQSEKAAVLLTADQILAVVKELHACYDYCAVWKDPEQT